MNPAPLAALRLRPQDHLSALWWLTLLYRSPRAFLAEMNALGRGQHFAAARLYLHALPYVVVVAVFGRLFIFGVLGIGLEFAPTKLGFWPILIRHGRALAVGVLVGLVFGMALGIAFGVVVLLVFRFGFRFAFRSAFGLVGGIASGIVLVFGIVVGIGAGIVHVFGIAGDIAGGMVGGIAFGLVLGSALGIALGVVFAFTETVGVGGGVAGGVTVGIVGAGAFGVASGGAVGFAVASGIAAGIAWTRTYYLVPHLFYVWPKLRGAAYRRHPVAWDDCCGIPFPGLCRLLADYARVDKQAAEAEIDRLIDTYRTQRHEALKARTLLVAEDSHTAPLSRLDLALQSLPEGEKGFLREVPAVKSQVAAIAQAQRRLDAVNVPAFREPLAAQLVREIRDFHGRVAGLRYPLNTAFREAALAWLAVAERQYSEAKRILETRPVAQVFRAGDPVERSQEAFLPRGPIIEELQGQITLATGCPGLLLYGRRRMGKSTLVKNLQPFLPTSITVASLSMLDPRVFGSLGQWVGSVAGCTAEAAGMAVPVCGDLGSLFTWLGTLDAALASDGRRVLLALDEYENLDRKLGEEVFPRDLLDTIRESIQRHRRITWLFAGSHALSELEHAEWSSWFVSLRTVELLPFSEAETRLLLTEPMRHSELWQDDEASRPRFDAAFWGEGRIERIHHETAGWPHLVQLLAERAVYLVNLRGLRACTLEVLDDAIAGAIASGDPVLRQLVYGESRLAGEWEYLKGFRTHDVQEPPADEAVYQSLRRRLMVTEEDGGWRMRVPLMQRWLRERG